MGASGVLVAGRRATGRLLIVAWLVSSLMLALEVNSAAADAVGHITEFGVASGLNPGSFPRGIAPGPDGNLWFADTGTASAIGRISPFNGHIDEFSAGLGPGSKPYSVAPGPDGNLWFTDNGTTKAIGRINPFTGHIDEFSIGLAPGSSPRGIALGPDGNLWFADGGSPAAIGRINPSTGHIDEFVSAFGLNPGSNPGGMIAAGADGSMWFADQGNPKAIGQINPSSLQISEHSGLSGTPSWIAPGPDGNLWFTEGAPFIGGPAAIGRITTSGGISEYTVGLNAGSKPLAIAPGADGTLWFGDHGSTSAIGQITVSGNIVEHAAGTSNPVWLAPGADGNVWFGDQGATKAIGRIGTGAPSALQVPPTVSGSARAGDAQTCTHAQWSTWAGVAPSPGPYAFNGFRWFVDGAQVAGQHGAAFAPPSTDVGHQLACREIITYSLPLLVTVSATSTSVLVRPPKLSALRVSPRTFPLTGRLVGGHCVKRTSKNSGSRHCRRPLKLRIHFKLGASATVIFTVARGATGRKVKGRCVKPTNKNRGHRKCSRLVRLRGKVTRSAPSGATTFTFDGRIGGHKLGPGSYQLTATATANGHTGSPHRVTFKIVR